MKKFSCIIFDIDGTLTQTNELIFATFNHVAGKYLGKTFAPAEITAMFGPPEEIAVQHLVGAELAPQAVEDFHRFYEANHAAMASSYPGIPELLEILHQEDVLLAVFTGKGRTTTLITLELLGLLRYFDLIVSGSDVVAHKPSAEGIRTILATLGVTPGETLMVGDAVNDVKASHEAGVSIAAVVWDSYAKDRVLELEVDFLFHNVADFSRWIRSLVQKKGEHVI